MYNRNHKIFQYIWKKYKYMWKKIQTIKQQKNQFKINHSFITPHTLTLSIHNT